MLPIEIKLRCSRCKQEKDIEEFHSSKATQTKKRFYRSHYCKTCCRESSKENYLKNKKLYRERTERAKKRRRKRNRKFILNYFLSHPCVDCGETDPIVLQFDHIKDKEYEVSYLVRNGLPTARILAEIKKCEVVCANCHVRRTAKRGDWWNFD